jgi:hypothetical protein
MTGPQPYDSGEWVAYCATGRLADAKALLAMRAVTVAAVVEHPWLPDTAEVVLVNPASGLVPPTATAEPG